MKKWIVLIVLLCGTSLLTSCDRVYLPAEFAGDMDARIDENLESVKRNDCNCEDVQLDIDFLVKLREASR
jgi:hypothetical protein